MWQRPKTDRGLYEQAGLDGEALARDAREVACPDGHVRRILQVGSGTPVVFVPVVREVNFVWAPQIERFSRDHRVVLFDPVTSDAATVSIADRSREIAAVLEALEIDTAHVVAWSDGGSSAYAFAETWPERCRSLVFIGLADRFSFGVVLDSLMELFRRLPIEPLVPESIVHRFIVHFLSGPVARSEFVRTQVRTIPKAGKLAKYNLLPLLQDHRPNAGGVRTPAIMICGDNDALVSVKQAQRMAALLPNCMSVDIIPEGEHFLPYVSAEETNRLMEQFFQIIETGRAASRQ